MTNELEEFCAYTQFPEYRAMAVKDVAFFGRFTFDMFFNHYGFDRIFTVLARHYLFENGNDPYDNVDFARCALCAWCSVPTKEKVPVDKSGLKVNFKEYHAEFPELVDEKGAGWYYRHIKNVIKTIKDDSNKVSKPNKDNCAMFEKKFLNEWKTAVRQFNIPAYSGGNRKDWLTSFDDCIAEALTLGPLKDTEITLSEETLAFLKSKTPKGVPETVLLELVKYYLANKTEDGKYVVLPEQNFAAYFGNSSFTKQWLFKLPKDVIERKNVSGVCKFRVFKQIGGE